MDDLKACLLPQQNGPSLAGRSPSKLSPQPGFPAAGLWPVEQITQRIAWLIQPTRVSEEMRKVVVEYVQKLIKRSLGAEVFPFGSVPLKTYLPDGDIDLTVIGVSNIEDNLASDVHAVLEEEEKNKDADLEVKDVQYINAEVKLVKCLIENVIVDISFSQLGGLRTLCFLEQVDILIGKDNLFKRSIILIKAWCYYESRILGAHHALISTYALETMILYIFHLFHSSLDGPLSVLYRFLDYFSKFDWDKFCISLRGPVQISFLPVIVAEPPDNDGADLLFSAEFLNTCGERVFVPPRASEDNYRLFVKKYLNIIDPLKENNNLGRSVSRGNFYRIRSAFAYGAKKLHGILVLSGETMEDELKKFFANTIERHGSGERPDVQHAQCDLPDSMPFNFTGVSNTLEEANIEKNARDNMITPSSMDNFHGGLCEDPNGIRPLGSRKPNGWGTEPGIQPSNFYPTGNHLHGYINEGVAYPAAQFGMDLNHLAAGRSSSSRSINEIHNHSPKGSTIFSPSNRVQFTSYFTSHCQEDLNQSKAGPSHSYMNGLISSPCLYGIESSCNGPQELYPSNNQTSPSTRSNGEIIIPGRVAKSSAYCSQIKLGPQISWAYDSVELSGDDSGHRKNLVYAQWCLDHTTNGVPPGSQSTHFHSKNSGDALRQPSMVVHMNGIIPSTLFSTDPNYHLMNFGYVPGSNGMDGMPPKSRGIGTFIPVMVHSNIPVMDGMPPKSRGIGTFIPVMNHRPYRERPQGRGKNQLTGSRALGSRSHCSASTPPESGSADMEGHKMPPLDISRNGCGKPALLEIPQASSSVLLKESPKPSSNSSPERQIEFGTYKSASVAVPVLIPVTTGTPNLEAIRTVEVNGVHNHTSSSVNYSTTVLQKPHTNTSSETAWPVQPYHLKDDEDFPPLACRSSHVSMHLNLQKTVWKLTQSGTN